jgi:hypothetical protein
MPVLKDQPTKITLGLEKSQEKMLQQKNSGLFPLNYGNLELNMRVINF